MARYTKEKLEEKKRQAKEMYIKGFELETIASILEVALSTVKRWAKENDFETAKQSSFIALSELRNTILQSFIELKNGGTPKIKPDEAAKYASAFEKLSDKKKVLSYMYESFEALTTELTGYIQKAKTAKEKDFFLQVLKIVRRATDAILTRLTAETLNEN